MKRRKWLLLLVMLIAVMALPITAHAKVKINKKKATIQVGKTVQLKVTGTKSKAKWSSNKKKVATVNGKGKVTGKSAGKAIITAKVGGKKYKCTVTVNAASSAAPSATPASDSEGLIGDSSPTVQTGTVSQQNAMKKATSYLSHSAFSKLGLIDQLVYEKFSEADAKYAVEHITVDWNAQALKKAKSYLSHSAFSRKGLIKQLEYEKFTNAEAVYGTDNSGANWYDQAAKKAKSYLSHSSFSHDGLVGQLLYEGYTQEEAEYGVKQTGL